MRKSDIITKNMICKNSGKEPQVLKRRSFTGPQFNSADEQKFRSQKSFLNIFEVTENYFD